MSKQIKSMFWTGVLVVRQIQLMLMPAFEDRFWHKLKDKLWYKLGQENEFKLKNALKENWYE